MRPRQQWARLAAAALLVAACEESKTPELAADAGVSAANSAPLFISELMYHPVLEDTVDEQHEFIELHNPNKTAVALAGWKLAGAVRFTFPSGASIAPGAYVVVAKNKRRLAADVPAYKLVEAELFGDYAGALDNGGERLQLLDPAGRKIDEIAYDDERPWPIAADALGAGEDWLPAAAHPLEKHKFMGRSLERLSFAAPGTAITNWAVSPLDGATPGRPNSVAGRPLPLIGVVTAASAKDSDPIVGPDEEASVYAGVIPAADGNRTITNAAIEYFVDDLAKADEVRERVALAPAGTGWQARLPARPAGTIVRYRVIGDRGRGLEVLAPPPSDPAPFFAYFVQPDLPGKTPAYQLFISPANWTDLFRYSSPGRVPGNASGTNIFACQVNELWTERVPAVLVVAGKVYDVRVRYQGSFQNRMNGLTIPPMRWPTTAAKPTMPNPVRVLSWSIKFPRYDRFEGVRSFNLNKLTQSCHGFNTMVGNALFERAGVPAARSKYVRFFINGAYYHYMLRMEHMDDDFIQSRFGKGTPGDLFKAEGGRWDEGPFGYSDMRILEPACGYTLDQRYEASYSRSTNEDFKSGGAEMRKLIEDLAAARSSGIPAIRKFFEDNFAMEELGNYMAVINWMVGWDDHYHNHYFYKRVSDGRWMMMPTDLDNVMGGADPSWASASFFVGQWAIRSNRNDYWSYLKDAYLRAFRGEFIERVKRLSRSVLHPDAVAELMNEVAAQYQAEEASAAPAGTTCGSHIDDMNRLKKFAYDRAARVEQGLFD